MIRKQTPHVPHRARTAISVAEARVLEAARSIGNTYLADRDPSWGETNELEQAAILLARADRDSKEQG